ncbi:Pentatricopeptide repeat-containing protein [Platanthera zijinensis]|uniref:Pentatricopeptide repeat-containing protein n=1 Tax=Platanthera zijinensis TaxID=2320716 RepID=A0AAP0B4D9_9ASPA
MASLSPSTSTHLQRPAAPIPTDIAASSSNKLQLPAKTHSLERRCSNLLQSCSSSSRLAEIHGHLIRSSLHQNHFLAARLLSCCFSLGRYSYASRFFGLLLHPDVFLFNVMIKGFVSAGFHGEALRFYCMLLCGDSLPNDFTLPLVLKACSKLAAAGEGRTIHGHVLKLGYGSNIFIQTALVDLYGTCWDAADARKLFDRMTERDVVSWNAMVSAYVRSGSILLAERLFDEMPVRNVNSWTAMIGGLMNAGDPKRALTAFRQMQLHGVRPDKMVIVAILSAISNLGYLSSGKWVHDYIRKNAIPIDAFVGTALIDMYSKSGSIRDARLAFQATKFKNTSCYNAMIFGLAVHGLGEEAISVFEEMKRNGIEIDDVTMIAVLTSCSHSGLVEEGLRFFETMRELYGIDPRIKHHGCVVDLLGRAGRFAEAMEIVDSIEVDHVVMGTLAAACRTHGKTELAEEIAMRMSGLDAENSGFYVWRASVHAGNEEWEEAAEIRRRMKERGIEKGAGCSWIEAGEKVHWFVASDHSHPRSKQIYCRLDELYAVMGLLGKEG